MRTRTISFTDDNENTCTAHLMRRHTNTNSESLKRKSEILKKIIAEDLTQRQQMCAVEYWLNGKTQKTIAAQLGLNRSTVSRHIAAAKRKLHSVAKYLD